MILHFVIRAVQIIALLLIAALAVGTYSGRRGRCGDCEHFQRLYHAARGPCPRWDGSGICRRAMERNGRRNVGRDRGDSCRHFTPLKEE